MASGVKPPEIPTHRQVLGDRLLLHVRVRYAFAFVLISGALFAHYVVRIGDLSVTALTAVGLAVAAYNTLALFRTRHLLTRPEGPERYRLLAGSMYGAVVLDFITLTAAIWLVGGARSPFLAFYLLHVIVSSVTLSRRSALAVTALAYGFLVLLVLGEWSGLVPPHLPDGAVVGCEVLGSRYAVTVLTVYGALFAMTSFLLLSLTRTLREGERRIRLANEELGRLSEARRDFLDIALHDLKSPIGAVIMYLRNMREELAGPVTEKQTDWIERSLTRLDDLTELMKNMQTLSSLELGMIEAKAEPVDMREVLTEVVSSQRDVAEGRGHELRLELPRALPKVLGFRQMLREAVANYLTNAIKYTADGGRITVRAVQQEGVIRIEVEDTGIGVAEENLERLFDDFIRLPTEDTPLAKVGGSGLGLSIVRRVVEAVGGRVEVQSVEGEGSTFAMVLPAWEE